MFFVEGRNAQSGEDGRLDLLVVDRKRKEWSGASGEMSVNGPRTRRGLVGLAGYVDCWRTRLSIS